MVRGPAPCAAAEPATSRRALLRTAGSVAAGGSAALLAACSTKAATAPPAATPGVQPSALQADVVLLNSALDLEHTAIAAYTAGIPLLSGAWLADAKQFLGQELSHAAELSALISEGGGKPNLPNSAYSLGNPRRAQDVLTLLHTIEAAMIRFYLDALPRLRHGIVRSTVASILANEAEHISVLREAQGHAPVPSAFVTAAE